MSLVLSIPLVSSGPLGALVTAGLMWAGLGLASVPVIIHLLNRRRVQKVQWAAMAWLAAAIKRHQRRLKVENWLVLFLRMAAIALLGLALARPILEDSKLAGALGGKRSLYLLLDNSYSTLAKVDARSALDHVKHQANQILDSLGPDDSVSVLVTNDPSESNSNGLLPYVLQARTVGTEGAARAKEAVAGIPARHAPARWAEAFDRLSEQMAPEDVGRQVYVLTDFQARDWTLRDADGNNRLRDTLESTLRAPAAVRIIDVGGRDRRNLSVSMIETQADSDPFAGLPVQLAVTVSNFGERPVRGASLHVGVESTGYQRTIAVPEIPAGQTALSVPTPGTAVVRVDFPPSTFPDAGVHLVHCTIGPPSNEAGADGLGLDSKRWFALEVRPQIRVLGFADRSRRDDTEHAEDYLRAAYEGTMPSGTNSSATEDGLPWFFAYESVRFEGQLTRRLRERGDDDRRIDVVLLANTHPKDPDTIALLQAFVNEGGGLMVFTGDKIEPSEMNATFFSADGESLLPRRLLKQEKRSRSAEGEAPFEIDVRERKNVHPLAVPFLTELAPLLTAMPPKVWGRLPFEVQRPKKASTPPREDGATPFPDSGTSDDIGTDGLGDDPAVVLTYRDGTPAIVAGEYGSGRTVWIGTSVDNGWVAEALFFTPILLHDAAMWLTEPRTGDRNLQVGSTIRARAPVAGRTVRLTRPGGQQITPNAVGETTEGMVSKEYRYADVGTAGPWRFSYERPGLDGHRETISRWLAVNVDPSEGSLTPARQQNIAGEFPEGVDLSFATSFESDGEIIDESGQGELTRWLLWAVLAFLLLESFLALRFGRRSVVTEDGSGEGGSTGDSTTEGTVT